VCCNVLAGGDTIDRARANIEETEVEDDVRRALASELREMIQAERARKSASEARGLAVITTSGGLVVLLLGLAAFVIGKDRPLSEPATGFVVAGMALFVVASVLGITCNAPLRFPEIAPTSLLSMTRPDVWSTDGAQARRELAVAQIRIVESWRRINVLKARLLVAAITAEVAAVAAITVAAILAAEGGRP
jgi:hypothetical protein